MYKNKAADGWNNICGEKNQHTSAANATQGVSAGAGGFDAAEGDGSGQKCDPADRMRQAICDGY